MGRTVCHKCAVPFDPMCANSRLFNTTAKRFRAGLAIGESLILQCDSVPISNMSVAIVKRRTPACRACQKTCSQLE